MVQMLATTTTATASGDDEIANRGAIDCLHIAITVGVDVMSTRER
jgi:hypothetical protein